MNRNGFHPNGNKVQNWQCRIKQRRKELAAMAEWDEARSARWRWLKTMSERRRAQARDDELRHGGLSA